jgi:hypothetical protein
MTPIPAILEALPPHERESMQGYAKRCLAHGQSVWLNDMYEVGKEVAEAEMENHVAGSDGADACSNIIVGLEAQRDMLKEDLEIE